MVNDKQVVSTAVSEDSLFIPLIDFSLFLNGNEQDRAVVGKGMADGFRDAGFIYIKNHGIPQEAINKVFSESAKFFRRPREQKDALAWASPQSNRGYVSPSREKVTQLSDKSAVNELRSKNPDLKESFEIGRDDVPEFPNNWPDRFDEEGKVFKDTMKRFFNSCRDLHIAIMRSIALGMGLDEYFFDKFLDAGDNTLRLLHYPAQPKDVFVKGQVRAGKHTDFGSVTLLFQDSCGGLQVRSPNGNFVNATPIPGTIVINAGDLLARWSNNKILSTEHQVVEPPTDSELDEYPARYSCAYFCNPNFDAFIEAIPGTYETEKDKIYPGVNSWDYLVRRLDSTYD